MTEEQFKFAQFLKEGQEIESCKTFSSNVIFSYSGELRGERKNKKEIEEAIR